MSGPLSHESLSAFRDWALADGPETTEWVITRGDARTLVEAQRELHRRAQEAESKLAQGTPEKVQALDRALAEEKVEKHKYRDENRFMKNERKRLQARIRELQRGAREQRIDAIEGLLELLSKASLPFDEADEETVYPHHNGYSMWLVGREQFEGGLLLSSAPLEAAELVDRIEKHEARDAW